MTEPVYLSVIIPARNEEKRLPDTLNQALIFLAKQPFSSEIIVVENGSTDGTAEIAAKFASEYPHVTLIQERAPGKGGAVRRGMLAARGEYRFMADADLSMPIREILRFLPPQLAEFDIAIGSREASGAVRYNEPYYRHLGGRLINSLIRWFALPGLNDTQCGFKCFRGEVADHLFSTQTLAGWSFDIELLYIARKWGYTIVEVPIPWYFNPESKLSPVKDAIQMAVDILKIRRNAIQGLYAPQNGQKKI